MTDETAEPVPDAPAAPHTGGRPSLYKPEYAEQVLKLCLLGATDKDIADFFEVCEATINNWKLAHPEFVAQLKAGKKQADIHIASKLFNRAEGARWTEQVAVKIKVEYYDEATGKKIRTEERVEVIDLLKGAAPDTTAIIFWLKNRDPRGWRDKQELQHTGKDGEALQFEQVMADLPEEMLIVLDALQARLASGAEDGADQPAGDPA